VTAILDCLNVEFAAALPRPPRSIPSCHQQSGSQLRVAFAFGVTRTDNRRPASWLCCNLDMHNSRLLERPIPSPQLRMKSGSSKSKY
jgi:hypothetical protein